MLRYPDLLEGITLGRAVEARAKAAESAADYTWAASRLRLEHTPGDPRKLPTLSTPADVSAFVHKVFPDLATEPLENVIVVALGPKRHPVAVARIYRGSMTHVSSDPANILRAVLLAPAIAFIVCHNHPSGNPTPSAGDINGTVVLQRAARYVGITLIDHIVLSPDMRRFASIRELNPSLWS